MPAPDAGPRPATLIVAVIILVLVAATHLASLTGLFLRQDLPPIWVAVGTVVGLLVGIGGLAAAIGLLQARRWSWFAGLAVAAVVTGSGFLVVGLIASGGAVDLDTQLGAIRALAGSRGAILGPAAILLLLWPASRSYCLDGR